jgi:hypothetical protein
MPRYKPAVQNGVFIPVVFDEQLMPNTFEFALNHSVDHELDLAALAVWFQNDETGASAYDPRVTLSVSRSSCSGHKTLPTIPSALQQWESVQGQWQSPSQIHPGPAKLRAVQVKGSVLTQTTEDPGTPGGDLLPESS